MQQSPCGQGWIRDKNPKWQEYLNDLYWAKVDAETEAEYEAEFNGHIVIQFPKE